MSAAARSPRLRRRPSRTVPASIVAVLLLAIGVLAVVAAVGRLVDGRWASQVSAPASAVAGVTWGSAAVLAAAAVVAVLGLVLLVAALKPGGHKAAALQVEGAGVVADREYVVSTRAVARLAVARADDVDGVDQVSASASGRRVHVDVTTSSQQRDVVRSQVLGAVSEGLTGLGLSPRPRVTVAVRTREV
ncbi:DUF6286 domain-containing protein [Microlunatus flavus]|uniref:DUF6286 domain-containing protein n=1 Tax=Microlunatus flavus TaxID=1036181 RepID=A0A1H9F1L3_9ACTN|nr:DUF6286 domain-containing protein [Microlunatus flavus]SEQ31785.1 hypothetical protein SAMN05421756_103119 [Microlunatus flavus]